LALTRFTENDIYLFKEGNHFCLYDKLGSHFMEHEGQKGVYFAVWVPNAKSVSVIGDFNGWDTQKNPLNLRWDSSGIWECFIPGLQKGTLYKYHIESQYNNYKVDKSDPYGFNLELSPETSTKIGDLEYSWQDSAWMKKRKDNNNLNAPMSIYEVHPGSWRRVPEENNRYLTYREMAKQLVDYVKEMGFTHVEFMPVMAHPFYGSWGYQITGYFAPDSRYGSPQDLMYLIEQLHNNDIGVILDWVPSHFPSDIHGLIYADGTHLYEHADARKGFQPDWQSYIFNYGRNEVRNFLISNAMFWLDKYHVDGLRVDAVASMLYLDYSRKEGEWEPNNFGGRENLEAVAFLKRLNEAVYKAYPDIQVIAEESTAWPMVTRPLYMGGLGFGMKWNMGWMHDILDYMSKDSVYRKYHQGQLTFSIWYAFTENFVLALSHDEVVHGKQSLISKMPGDDWQKFANLRLLYGHMFTHPGKKLLFMGGEFAQRNEWNHELSLDWHLLQYQPHQGIQQWVKDLNRAYKEEPALNELDFSTNGFEWIDHKDYEQSIVSYIRKGKDAGNDLVIVCNFTPMPRHNYRVGVPQPGTYTEVLNSDSSIYGGGNMGNLGEVSSEPVKNNRFDNSVSVLVPPLGMLVLKKNKK
jgi:1,4-alpha-glucan branching enzyme